MASIDILVPSLAVATTGNSVTAERYQQLFVSLGHEARLCASPSGRADLVVALNAYRSAEGIASAGACPVIVVLTGTDIYRFLDEDPVRVRSALDRASWLVGLNDLTGRALEPQHREKLVVIKEAACVGLARRPAAVGFNAVVVGHLRDEKDPALVAEAVGDLPELSPVQVVHYGAAHSPEWARWARGESQTNSRFEWRGPVPRQEIEQAYAASHVLINSSRMEGGANTISEAVMSGLPILASEIPGNVGVLGLDYPGYFEAGNAGSLRRALVEISTTPAKLDELTRAVVSRQPSFSHDVETDLWTQLLSRAGFE